jgi:hypothetical protein
MHLQDFQKKVSRVLFAKYNFFRGDIQVHFWKASSITERYLQILFQNEYVLLSLKVLALGLILGSEVSWVRVLLL